MKKKPRVLFVSGELIAGDLCYRLKQEGCDVRLFIEDESRKDCFDGMVEKVDDWKKELEWVGRDGLIVFDDIGYGKDQDDLRKKGYNVFGGGEEGDKLEKDREFCQQVLELHGIEIEKPKNFSNIEDAVKFIKKNKSKWVVKQNLHNGSLAYVGSDNDGEDVINVIESYLKYSKSNALETITLQKRVDGVEVAVGRFFNGNDWNSPILINFEHKPFLNGDIGPLTAEMGTLAFYDNNEKNKLFQSTLAKIKPYLQKIGYKGYIDINTIVNDKRIVPLEITARFGSPTNHLQSEMHISPWKDVLFSTAKGEKINFLSKEKFSLVVSVAIPPFPYDSSSIGNSYYLKNVDILFREKISKKEWSQIHFEEVSLRKNAKKKYYIAGNNGYILFITGTGKTVEEARESIYNLIKKIIIPKMMYRTDIGIKFIDRDQKLLKKWGWIK